jgi:hypothetical protein
LGVSKPSTSALPWAEDVVAGILLLPTLSYRGVSSEMDAHS